MEQEHNQQEDENEDTDEEKDEEENEFMNNRRFFTTNVISHLTRRDLIKLMDAKTHWIFAMTDDFHHIAVKLNKLHLERCEGLGIFVLDFCSLPMHPSILVFPREKLDLAEFAEMVGGWPGSREEIESMDYIILTKGPSTFIADVLNRWINIDPLLS